MTLVVICDAEIDGSSVASTPQYIGPSLKPLDASGPHSSVSSGGAGLGLGV